MEIANQLSDNAEYDIVHGKNRYMSIYLFDLSLTKLINFFMSFALQEP